MLGYYKQPDLTKEAFTEDGYLKTGDRGEIDAKGRLRITGRVKELFKTSKGKYVAPAPIENLLNNDPHVELSLVSGSGRPLTHAVIQIAEDLVDQVNQPAKRSEIEKALETLLAETNENIEEFEKVGFIAVGKKRWSIEEGHLTPTMKLKRSALEDEYASKLDDWYASGKKVIFED